MMTLVLSVPLGWIGMKYQEKRRDEIAYFQSRRTTPHIVDGAEEKIYSALNDDTRLEFIETPLDDILEFVKDQHAIPIEFDAMALEDAGVEREIPITTSMKGISLASALRLILRDLGLTCVVRDEVLFITTEKQGQESQVRVYNVAQVLKGEKSAQCLAEALQETMDDYSSGNGQPDSVRISAYRKLLIVRACPAKYHELGCLIPLLRKGVRYENPPEAK
jgi:hypothetical protein